MAELILIGLIATPLDVGYLIGHAHGYNKGARMVLDRLEPTIKKLVGEEIVYRVYGTPEDRNEEGKA